MRRNDIPRLAVRTQTACRGVLCESGLDATLLRLDLREYLPHSNATKHTHTRTHTVMPSHLPSLWALHRTIKSQWPQIYYLPPAAAAAPAPAAGGGGGSLLVAVILSLLSSLNVFSGEFGGSGVVHLLVPRPETTPPRPLHRHPHLDVCVCVCVRVCVCLGNHVLTWVRSLCGG